MSVIIVYGNCEFSIVALFPDTESGKREAIKCMRKHTIKAYEETDLLGEIEDSISVRRVKLPSVIENVFDEEDVDKGKIIMNVKTLIKLYDDVCDAFKKSYKTFKIDERRHELSEERRRKYEDEEEEEIDSDEIDREIEDEIDEFEEISED